MACENSGLTGGLKPGVWGAGYWLFARPLRNVKEIPFPRFAVVRREGLTPNRAFFVSRIPEKDDDDRFAVERVFAEEMPNAVFIERAGDWCIDLTHMTTAPIETLSLPADRPQRHV